MLKVIAHLNCKNNYLRCIKRKLRVKRQIGNMDCPNLMPPNRVRGMIILDREKFNKTIKIPMLDISDVNINSVLPHLKKLLFKMDHLKPVQTTQDGKKKVLLHPLGVKGWFDLPEDVRNLGLTGAHMSWEDCELKYENWKAEEILKSVLPEYQDSVSSYSRIGHIVHVNLREHVIEYKSLIGEVLKDKVFGCRTVVNKSQTIENTYRNFQMELLCGDPDYKVEVKENGISFEFDFSTVYWNPRLSTEHERIIKMLKPHDVLYDVFAGVGPFSVPCAKKKCIVLANDLNPNSFQWLEHNVKKNKVGNMVSTFNKDGRDFILADIKNDLIKRWNSTEVNDYKIHITMNLPALATEFLDVFRGLLINAELTENRIYPLVHVYCFAKGEDPAKIAKQLAEESIGLTFGANLEGVHFVRNVAPNKDMFRISFYLTDEILLISKTIKRDASPDENDEPYVKKKCN